MTSHFTSHIQNYKYIYLFIYLFIFFIYSQNRHTPNRPSYSTSHHPARLPTAGRRLHSRCAGSESALTRTAPPGMEPVINEIVVTIKTSCILASALLCGLNEVSGLDEPGFALALVFMVGRMN